MRLYTPITELQVSPRRLYKPSRDWSEVSGGPIRTHRNKNTGALYMEDKESPPARGESRSESREFAAVAKHSLNVNPLTADFPIHSLLQFAYTTN